MVRSLVIDAYLESSIKHLDVLNLRLKLGNTEQHIRLYSKDILTIDASLLIGASVENYGKFIYVFENQQNFAFYRRDVVGSWAIAGY